MAPDPGLRNDDEAPPSLLLEKVIQFREGYSTYHSPDYNEASLRQDFLHAFFEGLGWDIDNRKGAAEAYKDVVVEESVSVQGRIKRSDYLFRIGGTPKFLVEAKKPVVNILENPEPAVQLRRYGWNKKLPLCILTNFETFAVYDTRVPPKESDLPQVARVGAPLSFEQYSVRWNEISMVFSKESVLKGRFDKVASTKAHPGTIEVDDAFLSEIEAWREALAPNLKLRNQALSQAELNFAVQAVLDRIIFLRICEDRGVELPNRLQRAAEGSGVYSRLMELFVQADQKYNSGLFHFEPEKGRASDLDSLTPGLKVDDDILRSIIRRLYPPVSPYDFSALPVEILGQVYERFLGKVIEVTEKRARVVEKPEVRHAGGVFYTPSFIVDYIVHETVGKALAGLSPEQAATLRVVDPACGSGSFVLQAYDFLLGWHVEQYKQNPRKWKRALVQLAEGSWSLTPEERKRILLNNIFGVDIDPQAVEVTKLSLLLRVLEKTPGEVLEKQLRLQHERALPDLGGNIRCGNTLLDYRMIGQTLLDEDTRRRVNPFDWRTEFPEIMSKGGFDVVLGNPPYVRVQTLREWAPLEVDLYKANYKAAARGNFDIYVCFIERGLGLLGPRGRLGFILPHKFFNANYGGPIRGLISSGIHLSQIVHFGDLQVFKGATTYTCLLFLDRNGSPRFNFVKVHELASWPLDDRAATKGTIQALPPRDENWTFDVGPNSALFARLGTMPAKLGDVAHVFVGTQTSADDVFVLDDCVVKGDLVQGHSVSLGKTVSVEREAVVPFLRGKEIRRYETPTASSFLISPYRVSSDASELRSEQFLRSEWPKTWNYLEANRATLEQRERGRWRGPKWYGFGYPKSMHLFQREKLIVPDYNNAASFTLDREGHFFKTGYGIIPKTPAIDPKYLLGLLNSKLLFGYLGSIGTHLRGGYVRFWTQFIERLPIQEIDHNEARARARHDRIVTLVDHLLRLHADLSSAKTEQDRVLLKRQIESENDLIDEAVFALYRLVPGEIEAIRRRQALGDA